MAHAFYQVERLIHYRRKDGHFLVKWVDYPVSDNTWEHKEYRRLVGELLLVATTTRPDIAFRVCELSLKLHAPKVCDITIANKLIR